ncbi:UNVERIFIED_CONTAM: hypothetical protein Scaly_0084700 [Sesamum calycinum]|uniref:Uncharacterized protein n=1 Tax=Sesamum calycinum TaxID=2727403 RepID=A0AAW2SX16_9LAMI
MLDEYLKECLETKRVVPHLEDQTCKYRGMLPPVRVLPFFLYFREGLGWLDKTDVIQGGSLLVGQLYARRERDCQAYGSFGSIVLVASRSWVKSEGVLGLLDGLFGYEKIFNRDLGVSVNTPVPFFCNNKAALHITTNPAFHKRSKHLKIDCDVVRDKYKVIQPTYLVSK